MTLAILGIELEKSRRIMLSDWSEKLDEEQMEYACRDAWAGGRVFERLREVWSEVFGEEVLEEIVGMQMNVVELERRRKNRRLAKGNISKLKMQGIGFNSVAAKPHRKVLSENRPEEVPVFQIDNVVWPERVPKSLREPWCGNSKTKKKKTSEPYMPQSDMTQDELDIIAHVIENINNIS
ncbi:hypothetical protein TrLO_g1111 [Triparma laevis f. longispina]|uniref:Uncharacterized protein n=1 Tax=Triparma laevis f. longispina TaxID=1714387 RepID=A0A9W7F2J8_9STRA|nr:hypothetical protein TrLO_g1111 [Triparma laevis f. longispina]